MAAAARTVLLHWRLHILPLVAFALLTIAATAAQAQQTRVLGLDVSAWQSEISTVEWNTLKRPVDQQVGGVSGDGRDFVFIRSSRGGTTGFYNQNDADNSDGLNTLSQRYDDPYFIQNITRATKAGLLAGSYHFGRMDIIAGTQNASGIPNTGADEADHFLQMAGAWMRPGYLLPVFDLEAGIAERTGAELAQFAIDFSDRIYAVKGFRPAVYTGGNYVSYMANGSSAALESQLAAAYPTLWTARWPNQSNPDAIDVQNGHPKDTFSGFYGPWNDPNDPQPWSFWQYASTAKLNGNNLKASNTDVDVAHGGMEFLKDKLVPALWITDASGDWSTKSNWNSGVVETEPVTGAGQAPRIGMAWTTPAVGDLEARPLSRLPGEDDVDRGVDGQNDTVVLDRGAANPTITISSGSHNVRKLYAREALDITGGSLTINYTPSWDSTTESARFSAPVSISGGGSLSVHTLDVDSFQTFAVGNASLQFNTINLAAGGTPAKMLVNGDVSLAPLGSVTGSVLATGEVDLAGGNRNFSVPNGAAPIDVAIQAPISNGSVTKSGAGALFLGGANTYTGDTTVLGGTLSLGASRLNDASSVYLTTGATLNLAFGGGDAISKLFVDGVQQAAGTWGAVGSAAQFTSPLFSGNGLLSVGVPAIPSSDNVLDNFEVDEGHFIFNYNASPASQTAGLSGASTIERVTDAAQAGIASQLLNLVSDGSESWKIRHNSGSLGNQAAPAGNVPLPSTGYVGFWLKTDDPGLSVQIVLDDPNTGEMGTLKSIIADNHWHLYQWNLEDDTHWEGWVNGDGSIDQPIVTIDSLYFYGAGNAQIYLDTVSHNPNGTLAIPEPKACLLLAPMAMAFLARTRMRLPR
jgi:autotransporter-associated beta strand protein